MISVVHQGDHRYNVYCAGQDIGCITVSNNPYHNQHCYLDLGLTQFDPAIAKVLFSLLRKELGRSLQVMCYFRKEIHDFLTAGGFERKRRCFELEVTASDLIAPLHPSTELHTAVKGSPMYAACCELLYEYYRETHAPVSPLTVDADTFCANLPETVMCCIAEDKPIHYAFVELDETGYEIAYVGTTDPSAFPDFAQALVHTLFQNCGSISMECDDCDPAAMGIQSLFRTSSDESYDTYILK